MAILEPPDEVLQARVAALRRLASQDVVPAIHEVVQACCSGEEVMVNRTVAGVGRMVGYTKPVSLRFEASKSASCTVSEAAVVLGATAASLPAAEWRGAHVLELGCGIGYVGVLLAALGARVQLTDLTHVGGLATASIALNSCSFRAPASAAFRPLDWTQPRSPDTAAILGMSTIMVAADPVTDEKSQQDFLILARAVFGLDGEPPVGRSLRTFLVAHKHQQSFCISGYTAPVANARPAITHAEECCRCSFRRKLEDAGMRIQPWHDAPKDFAHGFVELWSICRGSG